MPDRRATRCLWAALAAVLAIPTAAAIKLAGQTATATRNAAAKDDEKPISIPFDLIASNHIVIKVKVNGKGPYRMIFDLGAPICLLSNRAGEASGAVSEKAPKALLFNMRGEMELDTIELGDLKAGKVPAIVFDHPLLSAMGRVLGEPLDGIIGYTFFARYRTTIDYQARTLTFVPVGFKPTSLVQDLQKKMSGPKVAKQRTLAAGGLWGMMVEDPRGASTSPGVIVTKVWAGSAAARAGLSAGDVITEIDGRWTTSIQDTFTAAAAAQPEKAVAVLILRDGIEHRLFVSPAAGI